MRLSESGSWDCGPLEGRPVGIGTQAISYWTKVHAGSVAHALGTTWKASQARHWPWLWPELLGPLSYQQFFLSKGISFGDSYESHYRVPDTPPNKLLRDAPVNLDAVAFSLCLWPVVKTQSLAPRCERAHTAICRVPVEALVWHPITVP